MMNWIKKILNKDEKTELLEWRTQASILVFLQEHLDDNGVLKEATLPDDPKEDNQIKFAPGLMDAMLGSNDSDKAANQLEQLVDLISQVAKNGDVQSQAAFYEAVVKTDSIIGIIDAFLQNLIENELPIEPYLYNYAYQLATETANRKSVKIGIAILGLCQNDAPVEELKILGLHDEFTLFATIALSNLSSNVVYDLWNLAQKVDGWGKIQLVERLAEMDLPNEIRDWLVYEGYKNSIMYDYLVYTCAVNGRLNDKLLSDIIDDKLFKSAGDILETFMNDGPTEGLSDYEDGPSVVLNYIRHANTQVLNATSFMILHRLKEYLEGIQSSDLEGWYQDDLSNCLIDINGLLNSKDWTSAIKIALTSANYEDFWYGKQAAQKVGSDIWDFLWKRLEEHPSDCGSWYDVTRNAKAEHAAQIAAYAIEIMPLKKIATGPEDSMGMGPNFQTYESLNAVLEFLEDYPGVGQELIVAGLKTPMTRTRNITLKTLEQWSSKNWSEVIKMELVHLKKIEPNADTLERLEQLLVE